MAKIRSVIFSETGPWTLQIYSSMCYIMLSAGWAQFKITMLQIDTNNDSVKWVNETS